MTASQTADRGWVPRVSGDESLSRALFSVSWCGCFAVCGCWRTRLIIRVDALAIVQQECEIRGWRWVEPVIVREGYRLLGGHKTAGIASDTFGLIWPSLIGMALSFAAGWLALKWLSRWLEHGRWHLFGYYCLFAAAMVFVAGRFFPGQA